MQATTELTVSLDQDVQQNLAFNLVAGTNLEVLVSVVSGGEPVDISDCTFNLRVAANDCSWVVSIPGVIVDGGEGILKFPIAGQLSVPGTFLAAVEGTYTGVVPSRLLIQSTGQVTVLPRLCIAPELPAQGVQVQTITANLTLTQNSARVQFIRNNEPGGLPVEVNVPAGVAVGDKFILSNHRSSVNLIHIIGPGPFPDTMEVLEDVLPGATAHLFWAGETDRWQYFVTPY